jgi:hypothetical protein
MSSRGTYLIAMLVILFLANICMLLGFTNWPQRTREGFAAAFASGAKKSGAEGMDNYGSNTSLKFGSNSHHEYFTDMLVKAPGTNFATDAIGSYDGVNLAAGLPPAAQGFRANHPNVPLNGPPVVIDDEHLFLFTNNQCKPECCDSTLACDGGCVCTTPEQRTLINTRGGNRVKGSDF